MSSDTSFGADCASAPAIQTLGLHQNSRLGNKFTREWLTRIPTRHSTSIPYVIMGSQAGGVTCSFFLKENQRTLRFLYCCFCSSPLPFSSISHLASNSLATSVLHPFLSVPSWYLSITLGLLFWLLSPNSFGFLLLLAWLVKPLLHFSSLLSRSQFVPWILACKLRFSLL